MDNLDLLWELVELSGSSIGMNGPVCLIWKADHKNCAGCPSEVGCGKLARLGLLILTTAARYSPRSFEDFQSMQSRINYLKEKILEAKTLEELKAIPDI